jgi:dTDP-4-dehydrorhamnose 3,5-epimerase
MLWVPAGFAHGFLVTSQSAEVVYKTTDFHAPEHERAVIWNDPDIAIDWPIEGAPTLSPKDAEAPLLKDADLFD